MKKIAAFFTPPRRKAIYGLVTAGALALTACLKALVSTRSSGFILACWRHSLATGLICQRLSEAMRIEESHGYTAGLIHDIGQLALLSGDRQARVLPRRDRLRVAGQVDRRPAQRRAGREAVDPGDHVLEAVLRLSDAGRVEAAGEASALEQRSGHEELGQQVDQVVHRRAGAHA